MIKGLNLDFEIDTLNDFQEHFAPDTPFSEVPRLMSEGKSLGFHRPLKKGEILITADTMVILPASEGHPGEILGKPASLADAKRMLGDLSGRMHQVITAVTLRSAGGMRTCTDTTDVWFKPLTEEEIDYYVQNFRPLDKAGAYAIQEWIGYVGITRIDGSYFNVVGFPVHLVYDMLDDFDLEK